jgi:hypothetical protein
MIKLTEILDEYKVNKPVTYKYKIGDTVNEKYSDEEVGEILDRRPNWAAVKINPVENSYIQQALSFDKEYSEKDEPWYLFKQNYFDKTLWYAESELRPYGNINENIITNTNSEKKTISIDGYDNVSYKFTPNTKFVELRIDKSPQYRSQHDDALGYYPDNSLMSNTFKESILNKIVKRLRERGVKAIVIDDTILMTNVNSINENIDEYKVNTPDRGYKIADWVYKYFTEDPYELNWEKAEYNLGPNSDELNALTILYFNMNIFERNTVTKDDIERWRNAHDSNLKDNTVDEILEYLLGMVLIKKNQSLNEYKINKPSESIPTAFTNQIKDAINRHIVSLVKEYTDENGNPVVEFIKDEKYGTHDAIIEFIKEHMVVNHYEFEKDGKEIIASPLNVSTISDEDILDYLNDNADLKSYINKVIWKAYFETVDIGDIRNKVLNYINKENHELNYYNNTDNYFDVYVPLVMNKVLDYYVDPIEIFEENDFVQQVNNTLLKSDFINEYKINQPSGYFNKNKIFQYIKDNLTYPPDWDFDDEDYWEEHADEFPAFGGINNLYDDGPSERQLSDFIEDIGDMLSPMDTLGLWLYIFRDYDPNNEHYAIKDQVMDEFPDIIEDKFNKMLSQVKKWENWNSLNEYKINPPKRNKYISLEKDEDGNRYYIIDKGLVQTYLESVIDPEYIDNVETFMSDEEGWEESTLNGLSDFDFENATGEDIEDFATSEMSFFLTSSPDEFPFKDGLNEYKINKPQEKYRLSWYEGPDQFQQEKIETTLANAEKIIINKLKTQYDYRKSYEYWATISHIDNIDIGRWEEIERIVLDPEPDGLYARTRVYDNNQREFVTTKTIKL